ncbi:MAG TPA: hypothetical protein VNW47_04875 [Terriglobales bacterium]|nr:hypothetical protein [Terriglobales bacterium]
MADVKKTSKIVETLEVPAERKYFKNLILANPNYFGTIPKFGGKVVKAFSGDTTYEQLTCLGLNPGGLFGSGLLEAVVNIKQHSGYGTDGCGSGTVEYVRFFVQNASGWHDLGLSSIQVYDLAGPLPLSYAVSVDFNEARKFCGTENILRVRAILSWQWEPTPGDPNFIPIWGNVVDANVQVAPWFLYEVPLSELIAEKVLTIDPGVLKKVDVNQPLPANPPDTLSYTELKSLYAKSKVPGHRFGFAEATKLTSGSISKALGPVAGLIQSKASSKESASLLNTVGLLAGEELGAILTGIAETSGDTNFEQLTCAGYNPQSRELEAVLQVRQNTGYSGNLCTAGSTEYVSFFAFFGGIWNALGTTQVQVHDLNAATPAHPISYAVFRISNLTSMPCDQLQGVPLRAILSWQTPPTGPDFIPVWGNVINTYVQPQIAAGDNEQMRLMRIGRVTVSGIGNATGLANPTGVAGDCAGDDSPFGGSPTVEGDFIPKIDVFDHTTGAVLPGAMPIIYQAWVTPSGGASFQLTNPFGIALFPPNSMFPVVVTQHVDLPLGPVFGGVPGTKYYTYMESDLQAVNPRTVAAFEAGGLTEGNYTIEIRGYKWNGVNYIAVPPQTKMIHVYNGYPHMELTSGGVLVLEQRPQVSITITAPSGDCGDVQVGDTIQGSYSVTDEFFSSVSLALVPITIGGIPQPENPVVLSNANFGVSEVVYDGTNTTGTSGTFTLKTGASADSVDMTPCGYTIRLVAWDRALVSDSCTGHNNEEGVGFCLRKKEN